MIKLNDALDTYSAYSGRLGHWLIVYVKNRDSDALDRSNFDFLHARLLEHAIELGGKDTYEDYIQVNLFRHWAHGWLSYLLVNPEHDSMVNLANKQLERLGSYPILDDDLFTAYELEDNPQGDE